jgi:hypothetical protein
MDDAEFDRSLVASAFRLIADKGWGRLSLVEAAQDAGLPVDRARARFPNRSALLLRFGLLADQATLVDADVSGTVRDRLFGMIMKRIDVLQAHRDGVLALFRALPGEPAAVALLNLANLTSMGWMLDAAGVAGLSGPLGLLRRKGLMAVWLWTVNAWRRDDSADLSATMAALDQALRQAEKAAAWLPGEAARGDPPGSELSASEPFEPPAPI